MLKNCRELAHPERAVLERDARVGAKGVGGEGDLLARGIVGERLEAGGAALPVAGLIDSIAMLGAVYSDASLARTEASTVCPKSDIRRGGILVRPVAYAVAAGDEDHRDGRDAGHEERVVIGAADHLFIWDALFGADVLRSSSTICGSRIAPERRR